MHELPSKTLSPVCVCVCVCLTFLLVYDIHQWLQVCCTWTDHLIPGLIFFGEAIIVKWQQGRTGGNSVQVYLHNQKPVSPRIRSL